MSGIMLAMNLSGCSFFVKKDSGNTDIQSVRQESENADKTVMKRSKSEEKEAEEILEICSKTYAKAEKEGKLDDLEMIRDLIKELGEKGFTAVDSENQVNMTEYEKLIQFSEKAEAKKKEALLEAKEENLKTKNELDKEIKERRSASGIPRGSKTAIFIVFLPCIKHQLYP